MTARKDSWKRQEFIEGRPVPYRADFSPAELERLRDGLIPEDMDDKWFIYYEEPHLFLHRSWTGEPVYRVTLAVNEKGASVAEALCVPGAIEADPEYQAQLLDFLIGNLLLGKDKPFPMPPGVREAEPGLLQHGVAGTGFPQSHPHGRRWWQFWR